MKSKRKQIKISVKLILQQRWSPENDGCVSSPFLLRSMLKCHQQTRCGQLKRCYRRARWDTWGQTFPLLFYHGCRMLL